MILYHLDQKAEWRVHPGLGMHKKDRGAAGSLARRLVYDLKPGPFHVVERRLRLLDPKRDVGEPAAASIALDQLLYRGFRAQRLQQLNQIRTVADLQQRFPHLVAAVDLFAM